MQAIWVLGRAYPFSKHCKPMSGPENRPLGSGRGGAWCDADQFCEPGVHHQADPRVRPVTVGNVVGAGLTITFSRHCDWLFMAVMHRSQL